jgi:NMD protein affecting ribosome stability and mRNA decay
MTSAKKNSDYIRQPPKDERAYDKRNEDPYQSKGKYQEPSICTGCGAIFKKGHWNWGAAETGAHKHMCPACQRIHDRVPAGIVTISGDFFAQHQQEILNLVHNIEAKEKSQHPLQRIMNLTMEENGATLALTDFHITKSIVEALQHAYQGESDLHFADKDNVMRASWKR